jgi:prepilin-type N-terminal cleavage/methylation domain-containing protein
MTRQKTNQNGFSLFEVLIAVALFAFVVMGVMSMTVTHIQSNNISSNHSKGVQLAEEAIEKLFCLEFADLSALADNPQTEGYQQIANYPRYTRTSTVTMIDADNYLISVSVNWKGHDPNRPVQIEVRRSL